MANAEALLRCCIKFGGPRGYRSVAVTLRDRSVVHYALPAGLCRDAAGKPLAPDVVLPEGGVDGFIPVAAGRLGNHATDGRTVTLPEPAGEKCFVRAVDVWTAEEAAAGAGLEQPEWSFEDAEVALHVGAYIGLIGHHRFERANVNFTLEPSGVVTGGVEWITPAGDVYYDEPDEAALAELVVRKAWEAMRAALAELVA